MIKQALPEKKNKSQFLCIDDPLKIHVFSSNFSKQPLLEFPIDIIKSGDKKRNNDKIITIIKKKSAQTETIFKKKISCDIYDIKIRLKTAEYSARIQSKLKNN